MLAITEQIAVLDPQYDGFLSRLVWQSKSLDAYDPRIRNLFAPMIPRGGWVLDGGAFLGSHTTVYAERVGTLGKVIAFEPAPRHLECLRYNTRMYTQVEIQPYALYDRFARLHLVPNTANSGATVVGGADEEGAVEVEAITIDSLECPRLDFIKLDVEGLVLRALEGAVRTLRDCQPIVVAEVGDNLQLFGDFTDDVVAFMSAQGYKMEEIPQMGTEVDPTQRDVLFRPV